jgi:hypothetical protein
MDTGKTPKGNGNDTATPENTVMSSEDNHIFGENKEEEKICMNLEIYLSFTNQCETETMNLMKMEDFL